MTQSKALELGKQSVLVFLYSVGVCILALTAIAARAQTVTVTDIANTKSNTFSEFIAPPCVNRAGLVAFVAVRTGKGRGIYTATSTTALNTIALDTNPEFSQLGGFFNINSTGTVVFDAVRKKGVGGGYGIYTAKNSSGFTTIARTDKSTEFVYFFGSGINDTGTVVFGADRKTGGLDKGIYTAVNSASFKTIALSSRSGFGIFSAYPAINSARVVAFRSTPIIGGAAGIYTASNKDTFKTIAVDTTTEFDRLGDPSINNAGTVIFEADLKKGGQGVYITTGSGALKSIAVAPNPEFETVILTSINNEGDVAIHASGGPAGGTGIFLLPSGSVRFTPVVRAGDKLFGSTVLDVNFSAGGFADNKHIAFIYTLENGVSGVARADISTKKLPAR